MSEHFRSEGNTLVLKQVEVLLTEGRAVGSKELRGNILVLVDDLHVRIIEATGELLRQLRIDTSHSYQPTGKPKGPTRPKATPRTQLRVQSVSHVLRDDTARSEGFEPPTF